MQFGEIVKNRRKELGYTQEYLGKALGVTAPAVNKWEKGNSYPDITLLAPLARLLELDLNTLMAFEAKLSEEEKLAIHQEVIQLAETGQVDSVFRLAKEMIQKYPTDEELLALLLFTLETVANEEFQEELKEYYQRLLPSKDYNIRNMALTKFIQLAIAEEDFEKAEELLQALPQESLGHHALLKIDLLRKKGETEQALLKLEGQIFFFTNQLYNYLLLHQEIEPENLLYSEKAGVLADQLELGTFFRVYPELLDAIASKDVEKTLTLLTLCLTSDTWRPKELYQHMIQLLPDQNMAIKLTIQQLDLAFIKDHPAWLELSQKYQLD